MTGLLSLFLLCAAPAPAASLDAELTKIADSLYDLQLGTASAAADALAAANPEHPAPKFYQALVEYQRWAADPEGSSSALKIFQDHLTKTETAAEAWIATSPAAGYHFIGAA